MRNLPIILIIFTYLIRLPVCNQSPTSSSSCLLHGCPLSLFECDSHSGLILCEPPPHPIWVTPLCERPLHSALALTPLSRLPFLRDSILVWVCSASDSLPELLPPCVGTLNSGSDTHTVSPTPMCRWLFDPATALILHAGLLSPVLHTGPSTLCCVDALLTLRSFHLPTLDADTPASGVDALLSSHLGSDTPLWDTLAYPHL